MNIQFALPPPTPNDKFYQEILEMFKEILALSFAIADVTPDPDKLEHYRKIMDEAVKSAIDFEPTPINEPIGEIYHDGKLVGHVM